MEYDYDAGEPWERRKHAPQGATPSFKRMNGRVVTTCPNTVGRSDARAALNDANRFEWRDPRSAGTHPDAIWIMHERVLYRAEPTNLGRSFHAFPETDAKLLDALTRRERQQMEEWFDRRGQLDAMNKWLASTRGWK
ncbi:MAG: hypothetical protein Q8Q09_10835 [Deltaproteobacteria bacterium]|nr:hypothetical protein [Deltaproteobacteria bacterium]